MEEGVLYQISRKDCEKIYIGETKFTVRKRIEQNMKDVKFGRTNNSIANHGEESSRQIDRDKTICLGGKKRLYPWKILESAHIKENRRV